MVYDQSGCTGGLNEVSTYGIWNKWYTLFYFIFERFQFQLCLFNINVAVNRIVGLAMITSPIILKYISRGGGNVVCCIGE